MTRFDDLNGKHNYFDCICGCMEHVIRFCYYTEEQPEWSLVYLHTGLRPDYRFYKRIWVAIKHVFGFKCKYGDFDETVLDKDAVKEIITLLTKYLEDMEKSVKIELKE